MSDEKIGNRNLVILGALIVQLCLGSIYAWSFFQTALIGGTPPVGAYQWPSFFSQLPFAAGLASFALFMIFAGRWQDRVGPRKVATVGGVLLGAGYILAFFVDQVAGSNAVLGTVYLIITYGIIGGAGIGFAYVCPIAALVKWFPDKKGTITGIAVAGFGAGALVFGYVEQYLLNLFDVPTTANIGMPMLVLGVVYLALVMLGSQLLTNPPEGWLPTGYTPPATTADGAGTGMIPGQMIRTSTFWLLWLMFVFAATAGLMTLGNVKSASLAIDAATDAVVIVGVMSLLNAAGRIVWGATSDRLGRENTMILMFLFLAIGMFTFAWMSTISISWFAVMAIASLIGFCFGGNFALFPSATADFFGSKNVGKNYGVMFTAYGIAGITGAFVAGPIVDFFGSYFWAFVITGILAIVAILFTLILKSKRS
ncbi:MAG: putative MFS-type transporter YhjX [Candidatus Thorarchaeota archaeon AB_25]|nr:MAG: putative MFS-type transporter YhjX [Candidatus Thorarchaeota archaeon AB_25]